MGEWTSLFITGGRYNCKGIYIFTAVYICQTSASNKGYHLSKDYVVPNEDYNTCNKIHHIQCLRHTEVRLHVFIKEKQNRDELQFLSSDT